MARKSTDLKRIKTRLDEIADRMGIIETELEKLRFEASELQSAQKVLQRLAANDLAVPRDAVELPDEDVNTLDAGSLSIRPEAPGTPATIGDMALAILTESGTQGLTSNDILEEIRKRWLPTLMRTSLSPPLSRLKAKNAIHLDGDRWKIGGGNEVADEFW